MSNVAAQKARLRTRGASTALVAKDGECSTVMTFPLNVYIMATTRNLPLESAVGARCSRGPAPSRGPVTMRGGAHPARLQLSNSVVVVSPFRRATVHIDGVV